jgi:hypothetical protein
MMTKQNDISEGIILHSKSIEKDEANTARLARKLEVKIKEQEEKDVGGLEPDADDHMAEHRGRGLDDFVIVVRVDEVVQES